jgi:hypothetical protein
MLNIVDVRIIKTPLYSLSENRNFLYRRCIKEMRCKSVTIAESVKNNFLLKILQNVILIKSYTFFLSLISPTYSL